MTETETLATLAPATDTPDTFAPAPALPGTMTFRPYGIWSATSSSPVQVDYTSDRQVRVTLRFVTAQAGLAASNRHAEDFHAAVRGGLVERVEALPGWQRILDLRPQHRRAREAVQAARTSLAALRGQESYLKSAVPAPSNLAGRLVKVAAEIGQGEEALAKAAAELAAVEPLFRQAVAAVEGPVAVLAMEAWQAAHDENLMALRSEMEALAADLSARLGELVRLRRMGPQLGERDALALVRALTECPPDAV